MMNLVYSGSAFSALLAMDAPATPPAPASIDTMLQWLGDNTAAMAGYIVLLPLLTYGVGILLKKASPGGAAKFASIPTHIAVLQGVCLLLLIGYKAFIVKQSLTSLPIFVFYLPLLSAGATLWLSSMVAPFEQQPGFERLSGMAIMAGLAFGAFYVLDRMHFFAGFFVLVPIAAVAGIFLALQAVFNLGRKRAGGESTSFDEELKKLRTPGASE